MTEEGCTRGHYICDIQRKSSDEWFRTDDNSIPRVISANEVSKYGYVILYERS